jgi:hypothetical protein
MNAISRIDETFTTQEYLGDIPADWSAKLAMGANCNATTWKSVDVNLETLTVALTEFAIGPKDGRAFLQGELVTGGQRIADAVTKLHIIGFDIDDGTPGDEIDAMIVKSGLWAVRYTTHSHMKNTTTVREDAWVKYSTGNPNASAEDYLISVKKVRREIAAGAQIGPVQHKAKGRECVITHAPMPKNRVVFILKRPFDADNYSTLGDRKKAWGTGYRALASYLGLTANFDQSCLDLSRLFYAPRKASAGSVSEAVVHTGKAVDIFALPKADATLSSVSNVYTQAAADMGVSDTGGKAHDLRRWAAKHSSTFLLATCIEDNVPEKTRPEFDSADKHHIECPFEDEHSTHGGGGTYVVDAGLSTGGGFVVHCRHNSCCERDRLDFVQKMIEDKWFDASVINDETFHLELAEAVVEAQQKARDEKTGTVHQDESGFFVSSVGVRRSYLDKNGEEQSRRVCSPLYVEGRTRTADGKGWGKLLRWVDGDSKTHYWAMPNTMLAAGVQSDIFKKLADEGVEWDGTARSKSDTLEYLSQWKAEELIRCTDKAGWYDIKGSKAFLVGDTAIGNTPERVVLQSESTAAFSMYSTSGSLEGWQDGVSKMAQGNTRLAFAISTAFAGPLVNVLGEGVGGFHFRGASKLGKTPLLHATASVFGPPAKYSMTWRATDNGLEGACVLRNDGVMILDEIGQADANRIGDTVYMVLNGAGKVRATKDGSTRDPATWTCLMLSSGEIGLAEKMGEGHKTVKAGQTEPYRVYRRPHFLRDSGELHLKQFDKSI